MSDVMSESCSPVCESCEAGSDSFGADTAVCDITGSLSTSWSGEYATGSSTHASAEDGDDPCNETGGEGYYYGV